MNFLSAKDILDAAQSRMDDQTTALRAKLLIWLNVAMRALANERPWLFLEKSASVTIANSRFALPADYESFVSLEGQGWYLDRANEANPRESFAIRQGGVGAPPFAFTVSNTEVTLLSSAENGTATFTYVANVPAAGYSDDTTVTTFPTECLPYFLRALMTAYTEYDYSDADSRPMMNNQLLATEMYALKKWDNKRKPRIGFNRHGYRKHV